MKKQILIFISIILIMACVHKPTVQEMTDQIQEKCIDLIYISEQDHPLNAFNFSNDVAELDMASFIRAGHIPDNVPVEAFDWETFFRSSINRDRTGRWQALKTFLESNLSDVTIFKTGNIVKKIYAVGLYRGHIVGFWVSAVET